MNAEKTVGHLLDMMAASATWMKCPYTVVSHFVLDFISRFKHNPLRMDTAEIIALSEEYREPVERICGCDPDDGGTGCQRKYRECWGAFVEQAPEWWWNVLTDRPELKRKENAPTLF